MTDQKHPTTPSAQRETDDAEAIVAAIRSKIDMTSASPVDWVWEALAVLEAQGKIESAQSGETPTKLDHGRSCPAWKDMHGYDCGGDCTCGLEWRIQLQTEQTMHAAWRKRAEEAEAALSSNPRPDGWVSVKERLPELERRCLIMTSEPDMHLAWLGELKDTFWSDSGAYNWPLMDVTHWRYVAPPDAENKEGK